MDDAVTTIERRLERAALALAQCTEPRSSSGLLERWASRARNIVRRDLAALVSVVCRSHFHVPENLGASNEETWLQLHRRVLEVLSSTDLDERRFRDPVAAWLADPAQAWTLIASARKFLLDRDQESWKQHVDRCLPETPMNVELPSSYHYLLWALAVTALLDVTAILIAASGEYRLVRSRFGREPWARVLLDAMPLPKGPLPWQIRRAWPAAAKAFSVDEMRDAVLALADLPGFVCLRAGEGDRFDPVKMEPIATTQEWVLCTKWEGLAQHGMTLQKIRVECATVDYLALRGVDHHPLTGAYRGVAPEVGPAHRLARGALNAVGDKAGSDSEMDSWLADLIAAAPPGTLSAVAEKPGVPFVELSMTAFPPPRRRASAVVSRVRRRGLRRADFTGEILMSARVEAVDADPA